MGLLTTGSMDMNLLVKGPNYERPQLYWTPIVNGLSYSWPQLQMEPVVLICPRSQFVMEPKNNTHHFLRFRRSYIGKLFGSLQNVTTAYYTQVLHTHFLRLWVSTSRLIGSLNPSFVCHLKSL